MNLVPEYITAAIGAGILLVGAIYREMSRRLTRAEKQYDEILPKVITIAQDVKFIRANCPRCVGLED